MQQQMLVPRQAVMTAAVMVMPRLLPLLPVASACFVAAVGAQPWSSEQASSHCAVELWIQRRECCPRRP